jgi:hypothetical protein
MHHFLCLQFAPLPSSRNFHGGSWELDLVMVIFVGDGFADRGDAHSH